MTTAGTARSASAPDGRKNVAIASVGGASSGPPPMSLGANGLVLAKRTVSPIVPATRAGAGQGSVSDGRAVAPPPASSSAASSPAVQADAPAEVTSSGARAGVAAPIGTDRPRRVDRTEQRARELVTARFGHRIDQQLIE